MDSLKQWRLAGIVTMTLSGFFLHYVFTWTGGSRGLGLVVPVNESVWEHLKLGYWSVVLFSLAEYKAIKHRVNNYYFAKAAGVLALELTIVFIFYGYTFIAGRNILAIDILSYFMGVLACQYLSYTLFKMAPLSRLVNRLSLASFILLGVLFGVATFYPPHMPIFKDPNHHTYGIIKDKQACLYLEEKSHLLTADFLK